MRLMALGLGLIMGSCLASQVRGEADGPDYYRVVDVAAGDVLTIRTEPNTEAGKIGEIPPDTDGVRNLGCQGGLSLIEWEEATPAEREAARMRRWCRVEFAGTTGWVAARFLAEGAAPAGGSRWRIVEVAGGTTVGDATLAFQAGGTLAGSTGCNHFNGTVSVRDARYLEVSPLATTRMACPDDQIAAQEQAVLDALQDGPKIAYDPIADRLSLAPSGNGAELILERLN